MSSEEMRQEPGADINDDNASIAEEASLVDPQTHPDELPASDHVETPIKRRRGRPPGSCRTPTSSTKSRKKRVDEKTPLLSGNGRLLFSSRKDNHQSEGINEVRQGSTTQDLDRSARRKSIRNVIERNVADHSSDGSELGADGDIARKIWDAELAEDEEQGDFQHGQEDSNISSPAESRGDQGGKPDRPSDRHRQPKIFRSFD